jgi:uncharacterized protein (TIGR03437 family)
MKVPVILLALVPALASAAPPSSLQFVPPPNSAAQGVVPMPNGAVAVFGAVNNTGCVVDAPVCDQTKTPLLSILSASGTQTAALPSTALGSGSSSIAGAAIDAKGNFWIVGETDSDDFLLVRPLYSQKAASQKTGFVAKLDPGFNILFSTFLGGQPAVGQTNPLCVALDPAGNAWVVGNTNDPNFPTTGPVFGTGKPVAPVSIEGPVTYTFVVKISSAGSGLFGLFQQLIFSRLLGGNAYSRVGCFDFCDERSVTTTPYAIAVGTDGNLTIAGSSNATNFTFGGFVARISADGSQLIWSTAFGVPSLLSEADGGANFINSVALDAANDVYLTGLSFEPIATTPGALQSQAQLGQSGGTGFAVKLSSDSTQVLFATNLTGTIAGVALDLAGNVWVTGRAGDANNPPNFPGLTNIPPGGLDFALELSPDFTALQQIFTFLPPTATQAPVFDSNGNLVLLASAGNLLRLNAATALTAPAVFAITNSAIPTAIAGMGPGELVTLYGVGLGPATGITGEPNSNGVYPTQLAGVSVSVNGVAAPLLYVGPDQINFQMPFNGLNGGAGTVVVTTPRGSLPALRPQAASHAIGIFVAVNEDFTANSPSNPAAAGSIVTLYLTGLGNPGGALDGAISPSANSAFQNLIEVVDPAVTNGAPYGVLYAGTAPELINGVDQVNVQLPPGLKTCPTGSCGVYATSLALVVQTIPGPVVTSNAAFVYTH